MTQLSSYMISEKLPKAKAPSTNFMFRFIFRGVIVLISGYAALALLGYTNSFFGQPRQQYSWQTAPSQQWPGQKYPWQQYIAGKQHRGSGGQPETPLAVTAGPETPLAIMQESKVTGGQLLKDHNAPSDQLDQIL